MDLTLNGRPVSVELRPGMSLLELLREELGVTSVKDGCAPEGSCGACTVLMDGKAVVSCAQKAERAAERNVVTQEGLAHEEREERPQGGVACRLRGRGHAAVGQAVDPGPDVLGAEVDDACRQAALEEEGGEHRHGLLVRLPRSHGAA